jgi:hypothetical protein
MLRKRSNVGVLLRTVVVVVVVLAAVVLLTRLVAMAGPSRDGRRENVGGGSPSSLLLLSLGAASLYLRGELPMYPVGARVRCACLAPASGFGGGSEKVDAVAN